jgi:RNA polymerase sigma-70 factor (ECF subfamily)
VKGLDLVAPEDDRADRGPTHDRGPGPPDFAALFRAEYRPVVGLLSTIVGDRGTAEDVAQAAFGKAYEHWDQVAGYERPGAWVRRVAINDALSWRRSRASEQRLLGRLHTERPDDPPDLAEVWRAVARLPGHQRAAVALFYVEDRTTAEVADILGCAEATARVHLHRGRQALAAALGEQLDEGDEP